MRNISFALTERQVMADPIEKDVTRRLGWRELKVGQRLQVVRKAQGLKPGEKIYRLCVIEVVSVRREFLDEITVDDCRREGFPGFMPAAFVEMFSREMACEPTTIVTRIEFRRIYKNISPYDRLEAEFMVGEQFGVRS